MLAADLVQRCKQKFMLSQGRLRRGEVELALLHLHGSLADGLRYHLVLYKHADIPTAMPDLLAVFRDLPAHPLTSDESDAVLRLHALWQRIAEGNAVTVTPEQVSEYQRLVTSLLRRYEIVVAFDETRPRRSDQQAPRLNLNQSYGTVREGAPVRRRTSPRGLAWVAVLAVLVLAGGALWWAGGTDLATSALDGVLAPIAGDAGSAGDDTTATPLPANAPRVGQQVRLTPDARDDIALLPTAGADDDATPVLLLAPGSQVQVVGGPETHDGVRWWQVQALNEQGWCPETVLVLP